MYYVCTPEYGTTIQLGEFNTKEEAEEFMKYECILASADETEDGEEIVVPPWAMFMLEEDDEIPFCEPINFGDLTDDLPF